MIISRKRFQKEVERRARDLYKTQISRKTILDHERKLRKLNARIHELEEKLTESKGSIKGFYVNSAGDVQLCGKESNETD